MSAYLNQLLTWPFTAGETFAVVLLVAGAVLVNVLPSEK